MHVNVPQGLVLYSFPIPPVFAVVALADVAFTVVAVPDVCVVFRVDVAPDVVVAFFTSPPLTASRLLSPLVLAC